MIKFSSQQKLSSYLIPSLCGGISELTLCVEGKSTNLSQVCNLWQDEMDYHKPQTCGISDLMNAKLL